MYGMLMGMDNEHCYTLTHNNKAKMLVDAEQITIIYESGNSLVLTRDMVQLAMDMLVKRGELPVQVVHEEITNRDGQKTDRLMAVLRKLPGVTFDTKPKRILYYSRGDD